MSDLVELLDAIAEDEAARDLLLSYMGQERDGLIPDTVAMELEALEAEYEPLLKAAEATIKDKKKQAQLLAAQGGKTVKGTHRQAVVYDRPSWDDDRLRTFLASVLTPEQLRFALQLRTVKTVAQIRMVK